MVTPETLFGLSSFSERAVFLERLPVWESLKNLKIYLGALNLGKIECEIPSTAVLVYPEKISIGKGTTVQPGAYIEGPCMIGENCQVRQGAYIRGNVLTGNGCVIGHATEVKHAIFLDGAKAAHFNYVGDSILGNRVNIGAGVICANFRLDQTEVSVKIEGESYKTGLKKFGAVLGDDSQIGCNSVINPGVVLGKGTVSKPCTCIQQSNFRKQSDVKTIDEAP